MDPSVTQKISVGTLKSMDKIPPRMERKNSVRLVNHTTTCLVLTYTAEDMEGIPLIATETREDVTTVDLSTILNHLVIILLSWVRTKVEEDVRIAVPLTIC